VARGPGWLGPRAAYYERTIAFESTEPNGIACVFFGFGTKTGALGIRDTATFGPEIGILGLISNAVFAFLFWQWWRTRW